MRCRNSVCFAMQMAELFATSKQAIRHHIYNILKKGGLESDSVVKDFLTTASDSKHYHVIFYALERNSVPAARAAGGHTSHRTSPHCVRGYGNITPPG